MDILAQIKKLRDEREWSNYRLAKEAGISENSLNNLFRRNNLPTIPTLEAICKGFGITLSQFFAEGGDPVELSDAQRDMLATWDALTQEGVRGLRSAFLASTMTATGSGAPSRT